MPGQGFGPGGLLLRTVMGVRGGEGSGDFAVLGDLGHCYTSYNAQAAPHNKEFSS